jgi:hypothetical protein
MWFYNESYWYKWRLQCLGYSTKNHTGTNRDSGGYVILQRTIMVQMEAAVSMWFRKNHHGINRDSMVYVVLQRIILVQIEIPVLCGSTKNQSGTTDSSSVYVVLQRIMLVQLEFPGSMWFYKE